ncbi:spore germination protein GerPE [Paenibacillus puerhi]|uniref:spore germination protein GerPE n=1 Tax=Paenibacillus puerhi TaxID=2692622 RepID=UPI00135C2561|nr:spore germination protein GerPE [Paenibacillus puerhi]
MIVDRLRTSKVDAIKVNSIGYASALFIGDLQEFLPELYALAVQREISRFSGSEGDLSAYPIFSAPIPHLQPDGNPLMSVTNTIPEIHVGTVRILAISSSSSFHVGYLRYTNAQSRVKNIRERLTALAPK